MQRLSLPPVRALRLPLRTLLGPGPDPLGRLQRAKTTSAPQSAEGPSAQSGGARSQDAAEQRQRQKQDQNQQQQQQHEAVDGVPDPLADADHASAPAGPKILNARVPGGGGGGGGGVGPLSPEQQREVDEHNAAFEKKHGRAARAEGDQVHKGFWRGEESGEGREK
ncbi:hypothetical protein P8C59_008432 [Phyllachora maydis]|uniref:Uncharacterized protein n=1 Tax=Phyllachora maydis TaxID=1825666 RepID=A0AAD9IAI6_9PEZI|nr:hypothetical protein P8C59_008432 [Phyllachora maydis]